MKVANITNKVVVLMETYIQKAAAVHFEALKPSKPTA